MIPLIQTVPTLPNTAWEQAVFVTLFVVFCLLLVAGLLNWFSKQQKSWQDFISKRDSDWQAWITKNDERVVSAINRLADTIRQISERLEEHDQHVEDRVNAAVERKTLPKRPPKLPPPSS